MSAPPSYDMYGLQYGQNWDEAASQNLQGVLERMAIHDLFSKRLRYVQGARIVFILDDSGSMNAPSDDQETDDYGNVSNRRMTRWEELQQFVRDAVDVYGSLALDGVDFFFLNRPEVLNVKVFDQISPAFARKPERHDLTPLSATLNRVLHDTNSGDASKVVINIVTDGAPRSNDGSDSMQSFTNVLASIPQKTFINIRLCTNDDNVVTEYGHLDQGLHRLDVNDDYRSEFGEVLKRKNVRMSRGEYLLKCTIGAADETPGNEKFDKWDETSPAGCCTIM